MIFRRSLIRELTTTAIGLFIVLLAILFTNLVIRILARAAGGTVAPDGILALLGFQALFYVNVLLSVTLFLTVLLTLSRWYRDSEMIVWFTSGQSLAGWIRPVALFGLPIIAGIITLSLWLSPWAETRKLAFERQLEARDELSLLTPGLFKEFSRSDLVVFVESVNSLDGTIRNIFLHSIDHSKDVTTVAESGVIQDQPNGDRFIVLNSGRRYEGIPGSPEFRIVEFEHLGRRIEPAETRALPTTMRSAPMGTLLSTEGPIPQAELFWRLSVPISAILLMLLAIPLAQINPRMGRSLNLVAAALLYMVYSNCLNIVQSFIAQGRIGLIVGLVGIHSLAALGVAAMFYLRMSPPGRTRTPTPPPPA